MIRLSLRSQRTAAECTMQMAESSQLFLMQLFTSFFELVLMLYISLQNNARILGFLQSVRDNQCSADTCGVQCEHGDCLPDDSTKALTLATQLELRGWSAANGDVWTLVNPLSATWRLGELSMTVRASCSVRRPHPSAWSKLLSCSAAQLRIQRKLTNSLNCVCCPDGCDNFINPVLTFCCTFSMRTAGSYCVFVVPPGLSNHLSRILPVLSTLLFCVSFR